ncbi:hypothetical protein AO286_09855 [Pseudomonas syringae]|nr:hypothetical protein AO286_09855 [Pseudomonas syringae]
MGQQPGLAPQLILEKDHLGGLFDLAVQRGILAGEQAIEDAAFVRRRNIKVFAHGEVFVHRRVLKLAPHARAGDLVLDHGFQLQVLETNPACAGAGFAAEHVEQGGLARAIGADHHMHLVFLDIEVEVVDRLEAVE